MTCRDESVEPSNINTSSDWNFNKCDYKRLYTLLTDCSWDSVLETTDVNAATDCLYRVIYSCFDESVPKKKRMSKRVKRFPIWFTNDIIRDTRKKLRLHSIWKQTKTEDTYRKFSTLRADLKSRVSTAYDLYVGNVEQKLKSDPRQFWRHISSLRTKGGFEATVRYKNESYSGVKAAEAFADFFASVFLPEVPSLSSELAYKTEICTNSNYVNIFKITHSDVIFGINKLKPRSSIGPDCIPPAILKDLKKYFCVPLCHIFNAALESGVYPPQWKLSRVSPIPKGSDKVSVEEFRPIAVLSSPAKVFESILHKYIYDQVDKFLCDAQHGFRRKRSVDTNLLTIVDYISTSLDRHTQVDVLYFDYRKAFDRVNNDILLTKLAVLGFAPKLLRLLADYMRDRQQFVRLGHFQSKPYHTRSGVSQGSILGPLLFLLMVNDIPSVLQRARCLLYADDLKLYTEVKSEADCDSLQQDVDAVVQWSRLNGMEFNASKCHVMTFGRMWHPIIYEYKISGSTLNRTVNMKDLGVMFDQKLTFHDHINALVKESFRRLGFVLRNCKDFHSQHVIRLLYSTLVRSKLEASMCVWNPHEGKYILPLEKVQRAFLRYVYKRCFGYYPFMYPSNFILGCLGYNSLQVRRDKQQLIIMCRVLRGDVDAPDLHDKLCQLFVPDQYLRSRRHKLLVEPHCRTVARAASPLPRTLAALNALLAANPTCDLFTDGWPVIMLACLRFCEQKKK